jgi:hypothetical protein
MLQDPKTLVKLCAHVGIGICQDGSNDTTHDELSGVSGKGKSDGGGQKGRTENKNFQINKFKRIRALLILLYFRSLRPRFVLTGEGGVAWFRQGV